MLNGGDIIITVSTFAVTLDRLCELFSNLGHNQVSNNSIPRAFNKSLE